MLAVVACVGLLVMLRRLPPPLPSRPDLIPLSMKEATAPYQLDAEHLEFILSSRRAMNLVDAAASLEEALCDENAADRLHR